jgi:hypothetical protein
MTPLFGTKTLLFAYLREPANVSQACGARTGNPSMFSRFVFFDSHQDGKGERCRRRTDALSLGYASHANIFSSLFLPKRNRSGQHSVLLKNGLPSKLPP